jgi:hypothetical protein
MTRPARGWGRGNWGRGRVRGRVRGRGRVRVRVRGRQGRGKMEEKRLVLVQILNRQRGIRWQRSASPARRENDND